ncbi:sugar phosphate isomerase/epimerase family protein [Tundrisphaera sp. TA3]|uniref:sugar phosphate isomerase/epimerase family protein n=1 Tax=Tundrisphaera sp. TA3 TaxID=3435775 RepID=UPI003EB92055
MIAYGFAGGDVGVDLEIARRIGADCVEVLPDWRGFPDPEVIRDRVADSGLAIHSAHGCWGGQSISGVRVDLAQENDAARSSSLADLRRCVDWLARAGGSCLVVHPGGLSSPEQAEARRHRLKDGLVALADHAVGTGVVVCVENMPPGVHPGSRMADLFDLVSEIDHPSLALALDTGHGHLNGSAADETAKAGHRLATTHVHDNDGRLDSHLPPGLGTIDWGGWVAALDSIAYRGPIMLECIRHLRQFSSTISEGLQGRLRRISGLDR